MPGLIQSSPVMRITHSFEGTESVFESAAAEVVIGRPREGTRIDLDLSPDHSVSRPHARIAAHDGECFIEDLGSRHGTFLNGADIKGQGRRAITPNDEIRIGDTMVRVISTAAPHAAPLPHATADTHASPASRLGSIADPDTAQRLALLYDLSLQFGAETKLDALLQLIVERVVAVVPGAKRGALLLGEQLLLKAHHPAGIRPSTTLAQEAMGKRKPFIWPVPKPPHKEQDLTERIPRSLASVGSAMYAPMLWNGKPLGVICVDNPGSGDAFVDDDLRFLSAIAHEAAMAVANHQLQEDLRSTATLLERLLTNFSPRIRDTLLEEARLGRLRLGGKKSEVTILSADMRGFTKISAGMEAGEIVEMLNSYFSELVEVLFRFDGTVDKFMGDAILAVFGSPVSDTKQQENAVRAALEMQHAVAKVNATRKAGGLPCCEVGIGIHSGMVVHGFIGSETRMEFTVIGEGVNLATRYCAGAGAGEILISPHVYEHVWKLVESESRTIQTKHGESLEGHLVRALQG